MITVAIVAAGVTIVAVCIISSIRMDRRVKKETEQAARSEDHEYRMKQLEYQEKALEVTQEEYDERNE